MRIRPVKFINESKSKVTLIKYDVEASKVSMLMQQDGIKVTTGTLKRSDTQLFNKFDQAFLAGPDTETLVFYSKRTKQIGLMSNEFSQLIFMYEESVNSIPDIKPIINTVLTPNKLWSAYEILQ